MKKLISVSFLTAAMLSPMIANAATADLKVIGTIAPAACVPNFSGGSTIDYGNIAASTLSASAPTVLPQKSTVFNVACDAPTKMGIKFVDERATTVAPGFVISPGTVVEQLYGLGAAPDGAPIGAYILQVANQVSDTGPVTRIVSTDGGTTWAGFGGILRPATQMLSFEDGVTMAPQAYTTITADVNVYSVIDKASNLPLADEIVMDGLSTFEVVYL